MFRRGTLILLIITSFIISSFQVSERIKQTNGLYIGQGKDGYSFCCKTANGIEEIVVFNEILPVILEKYPMHKNDLVGEYFLISYVKNVLIRKNSREEISTIIRLKKPIPGQSQEK